MSVQTIWTDANITKKLKIKKSNNSTFVILVFVVSNFRNIDRSTFSRYELWPQPEKVENCGSWVVGNGWGSKFGTTECKRPISRNFKITDIKRTKDELFDFLIVEFIFYFGNSGNFNSFPNCSIFKICYFSKLEYLENFWNLLQCKFF